MKTTTGGGLLAAGTMALALNSGAMAAGSCPNPAFQKQAQSAILAFKRDTDASGAVLVAVDGKPVLRQALGLAERELGVLNTPETKFRIGSITKQFTAAAILQLQEAGKLSIDDPISNYYADAPPAWSAITLRELLTHTSGVPEYFAGPDVAREERLPHTPEQMIKLFRDKPLQFEPGKPSTDYPYSNSGYILLGYVIEKVSGQSYADYLQQHIFGPLDMKGTGIDDPLTIVPGRAAGYGREGESWRNAAFYDPTFGYAAGALYSTIDDLLIWDRALDAGRVLKSESLTAMFTNQGHHYGFGWNIQEKWGQPWIFHTGEINGFDSQYSRYPKSRLTVITLFNELTPSAQLGQDLAGLCLGADVHPKEVAATPASLQRYAGYYDSGAASVLKIEPRDGVLATRNFQQGDTHLYPQGGGQFFGKSFDVKMAFQTGADGQVTGMLLTPPGAPGPLLTYKRVDPAEGELLLAMPVAQRIAAAAARAKAAAAAKPASP